MLTTGDVDPATAAALLDQLEGKPAHQSVPRQPTIRFYHGSSSEANPTEYEAWLTPHEDYARSYRGGPNTVHYVDLTPAEAAAQDGIDEINNNRPRNFLANQETSATLQRLPEAELPSFDNMPSELEPSASMPARANDGDKVQSETGAEGLSGDNHTQTDLPETVRGSKSPPVRELMDKLVNDEGGWR